jgi:GNAT superfamily N-acetyltransferase
MRCTLHTVEFSDAVKRAVLFPETDLPSPPPGSPARRVEVEGVCVFLPSTHPLGMVLPERLEEGRLEHVVGAVREFLTAEGRGKAIWSVSEEAEPSDLGKRLLAFGMKPNDVVGVEERHAHMVCLREPPPGPPAVVTREAESFEEFLAGMLVSIDAFEMGDAVRTAIEERARQLWTFRNQPGANELFVAVEDDEVIAFAGARFGNATVYLGGSGTRPDRRGRGAYTALVRARWDAAVEHGTPILTVAAGAMSRPILERLGFSIVGWSTNLVDEF